MQSVACNVFDLISEKKMHKAHNRGKSLNPNSPLTHSACASSPIFPQDRGISKWKREK